MLQSKVSALLKLRTADKDLAGALTHVSSLFVEDSVVMKETDDGGGNGLSCADIHMRLRSELERRELAVNRELLTQLGAVQDELTAVETDIHTMQQACGQMEQRLAETRATSGSLLARTDELSKVAEQASRRAHVAERFLDRFQLSDEDTKALSSSGPIDSHFFAALTRVRRTLAECTELLRAHQQRAGLELMDAMTEHQEAAYRRLYRWLKTECVQTLATGNSTSTSTSDASPASQLLSAGAASPLFADALAALQDRAVLFSYALEDVGSARAASLASAFASALTRGGPGGMPRPIEMHAHDPLRFVGDMCAWMHQAAASESELADALLVKCDRDRAGAARLRLLELAFADCLPPFRARVDQTLFSAPGTTALFKLACTLDFYARTFAQLLASGAALAVACRETKQATLAQFRQARAESAAQLCRVAVPGTSSASFTASTAPPPALLEATAELVDLLVAFNASLTPDSSRQRELAEMFTIEIESSSQSPPDQSHPSSSSSSSSSSSPVGPLLIAIDRWASTRGGLLGATLRANCLAAVHDQLGPHADLIPEDMQVLARRLSSALDQLVYAQAQTILAGAGNDAMHAISSLQKLQRQQLQQPQQQPQEQQLEPAKSLTDCVTTLWANASASAADDKAREARLTAMISAFEKACADAASRPTALAALAAVQAPSLGNGARQRVFALLAQWHSLLHEFVGPLALFNFNVADMRRLLSV